jgi:hypothetical protein
MSELDALDALIPETHPALDGDPWRRIIAACEAIATAEVNLRSAVEDARAAGYSWSTIGSALDTTRQAAYQRFGRTPKAKAKVAKRTVARRTETGKVPARVGAAKNRTAAKVTTAKRRRSTV